MLPSNVVVYFQRNCTSPNTMFEREDKFRKCLEFCCHSDNGTCGACMTSSTEYCIKCDDTVLMMFTCHYFPLIFAGVLLLSAPSNPLTFP